MDLHLAVDADILTVSLRDAEAEAVLSVHPPAAGITSLTRALQEALDHGHGECFWPAASGGIYWWLFRRTHETLEVTALWSRGGVAIWEHVFRATDAAGWVQERLHAEVTRLGRDAG